MAAAAEPGPDATATSTATFFPGVRAAASRATAAAATVPVAESAAPAEDARVHVERVRTLQRGDRQFAIIELVIGLCAAVAFDRYDPGSPALLWGLGFVTVCLVRLVFAIVVARRVARGAPPWRGWLTAWLVQLAACATLWGAGPLLFLPVDAGQAGVMTVLWLAAAGVAAPFIASSRAAIYVWFLPNLLPLLVALLRAGGDVPVLLALFAAATLLVSLRLALAHNELLTLTLRARFRNDDLVRQLRAQMTLAARASRDKTRFVASAAHDLRQPLHALGLFCAALDQRMQESTEKPLVRSMMRSIEALEGSFAAMLDISRLDAGTVRAMPQVFPVRDLFRRLYQHFAGDAELRDISLRFRAAQRLVLSDPQLLERVLANLLQNALRYTREGGVLVAARRHPDGVSLEVWDSGVGIAADKLELIFEEFYQVENPERDRSKGLGMGLAIVRRLCQLLGHPLQVRSVPGGGSVFRVVVPTALGGAPEAAVLGADTLPPRIAQQATVLLIDDEQAIRDAMAALLRPHRIELIAAASTADAVAMAEQCDGRIDLILSDWRLRGDDDGIRAVREVRRVCGESTPAVLITGDTSPALLKFAHEKGLVVMHKPLQPRELLLLIERLVH